MPRSNVAYRRLASRVLSERGIAAVWQLHLDALWAHLVGLPGAAALLLAIADAARGAGMVAHAGSPRRRSAICSPRGLGPICPAYAQIIQGLSQMREVWNRYNEYV
jgi:hypothetical protein